jgi:hypothetical protein
MRMDALQSDVAALVERSAADLRPTAETFAAVRALAEGRLGRRATASVAPPARVTASGHSPRPIPHLTEAWFC